MKYSELIKLNKKQQIQDEQHEESKKRHSSLIDDWSEPISFVKTENHNNHGNNHQHNICWEMFRNYSWSIGFIWYTQFAGPFRVGEELIDSFIYFKDSTSKKVSDFSSEQLNKIFSHSRFRIKESEGLRLKSGFNLLRLDKKIDLINHISSLPQSEQDSYFEYGGKVIDFLEV